MSAAKSKRLHTSQEAIDFFLCSSTPQRKTTHSVSLCNSDASNNGSFGNNALQDAGKFAYGNLVIFHNSPLLVKILYT